MELQNPPKVAPPLLLEILITQAKPYRLKVGYYSRKLLSQLLSLPLSVSDLEGRALQLPAAAKISDVFTQWRQLQRIASTGAVEVNRKEGVLKFIVDDALIVCESSSAATANVCRFITDIECDESIHVKHYTVSLQFACKAIEVTSRVATLAVAFT